MNLGQYQIYILKPTEKFQKSVRCKYMGKYAVGLRCVIDNPIVRKSSRSREDCLGQYSEFKVYSRYYPQVDHFLYGNTKNIYIQGSDTRSDFSGFNPIKDNSYVYAMIKTIFYVDKKLASKNKDGKNNDKPLQICFLKFKEDFDDTMKDYLYSLSCNSHIIEEFMRKLFEEQFVLNIENEEDLKNINFILS